MVTALLGGIPFTVLVALVAVVGVIEFYVFARNRPTQGSGLIGVPMVLGLILAFYFQEPLIGLVALLIGVAVTFALETLRHHRDLKRSLLQVGHDLDRRALRRFPQRQLDRHS